MNRLYWYPNSTPEQKAPWQQTWQRLRSDKYGMAGLLIVLVFFILALLAWTGLSGQEWSQGGNNRWQSPSGDHWFGTNNVGQDIFQRTIKSTGVAFEIGLLVSVISTLIGATVGALAGWYAGTWVDDFILWIKGVLDSIPFYFFVAALAFALQGHSWSMHLAMIATFWTTTGRLVRAEVMRLKHQEFIESARTVGVGELRILMRHALPNTMHIILIQFTIVFIIAIKSEVILSFLGLGMQSGVSWGLMLAESTQEVLSGQFSNFIAASSFLCLLLLGFNLLSDGIQDASNPQKSQHE